MTDDTLQMALLTLAEAATSPTMTFLALDSVEELNAQINVWPDGSLSLTESRHGIRLFDATAKEAEDDLFEWIRRRYPFAQISLVRSGKMYVLQNAADRDYRLYYREFVTAQLASSPHTTGSGLSPSGSTSSLSDLVESLPGEPDPVPAPRVPYSMRRPRASTQRV